MQVLIVAIPPVQPSHHVRPFARSDHVAELAPHVDGFSLMTYDYTFDSAKPGPNAPVKWQQLNVERILESGKAGDSARLTFGTALCKVW